MLYAAIQLLVMLILWRFRFVYAKRKLNVHYTFGWKSIFYLGVGSMLIYSLPNLSLIFLLVFPLFLLRRHVRVTRKMNTLNSKEQSYDMHLDEYLQSRSKTRVFVLNNFAVLFVLLVITEFSLDLLGFDPGRTTYDHHFSVVNELVEFEGYEADEHGIMHVDDKARSFAKEYIRKKSLENDLVFQATLRLEKKHYTPYKVGRDFLEIEQGKVKSEFSEYINQLKVKTGLSADDRAILTYAKSPINSNGFRSIEFENIPSDKQKVFLLGDSFTWGAGVENLTSSFADILTSRDFLVYNSGIVGSDLPQYLAVARKYVPKVKPDVLVVNVFLGNDIAERRVKLEPFQPQYFNTNAGTLMAAPHGKYARNAEDAYNRVLDQSTIPEDLSWVNFLASKTRITTLVWRMLAKKGMIGNVSHKRTEAYWKFVNETKIGYSVNAEILAEIEQICAKNNCIMIVSIIPEKENINIRKSRVDVMLNNFPYIRISNLSTQDYATDGHFDESGSLKYTEFLEDHISK